ncbi:transcriptional regulator HexR [Bacillus sp. 2205SS5-2]|uniref:transcriptional regulator HexR n=1 Tax=Bacillus sp. 2205SS5-2 TaxID=3109031 RepID=UPI0030067A10
MEQTTKIIETVKENIHSYSKSERRLAEVLLEKPHEIADMSIGKMASEAKVSDPTVVRFCRSLGFDGFKEFKLQLVRELAVGQQYVHREVLPGDRAADYISKIGNSTIDVLTTLVNKLDSEEVERVVQTLATSNWIEFWGFGASAAVATDAYHKFFRLGIPCNSYSDSHMQSMSASVLHSDSVVVAISHTGRSKELIENVRLAKKTGAIVLGITSPDSPLAKECSQTLCVEMDEDTDIFTPLVSRMAHLLTLDFLVVGVALRRGQKVTDRMKKMKEALSHMRLEEE